MSRLSKLHNWIKVEETEEMKESKGHLWTNADLAPNPPETRKWDSWSFFLFQVSDLPDGTQIGEGAVLTWLVLDLILAYNV